MRMKIVIESYAGAMVLFRKCEDLRVSGVRQSHFRYVPSVDTAISQDPGRLWRKTLIQENSDHYAT